MKLLIVEDSQPVSRRLQRALGTLQSVETEIADTLRQALECFRASQPQLVLLDIQLPDGSGLDLLQIIKRERPATWVLIFSNHAEYRQRCKAEGADYFFDKSDEFEALAVTVQFLAEANS